MKQTQIIMAEGASDISFDAVAALLHSFGYGATPNLRTGVILVTKSPSDQAPTVLPPSEKESIFKRAWVKTVLDSELQPLTPASA